MTIDEITRSVDILLHLEPPERRCSASDPNGDGRVTVAELIEAVKNALSGCPDPEGAQSHGATGAALPAGS